ncbi:MAG: chorismate mutase [Cyanobacteria bacterium P01_H01_bin.74]
MSTISDPNKTDSNSPSHQPTAEGWPNSEAWAKSIAAADKTLPELRAFIDQLDQQLLAVLSARATLVKKIGEIKQSSGTQPLDETRWQQVLQQNRHHAKHLQLCPEFIEALYTLIHDYSLSLETYE